MPVNVEIKTRRGTAAQWAATNPVLADGEPGLETDTGVIKYGDDESHWDELPAANKQFQNVVTVAKSGKRGSAGFICSEYDSDKLAIQAVLDAVPSNTCIVFSNGEYNINGVVSQTGKNLTLNGNNNTIFNLSNGGDNVPVIQLSGSLILTTAISSNFLTNSTTLDLVSVSNVLPGDLLKIYNTAMYWCPDDTDYPQQLTGEMYEISEISGNTVTLSQGLLRDYASTNTIIKIYRPINVDIENIKFIGTGKTDSVAGLQLQYCSNSHISKCKFHKHGKRALLVWTCYNVLIDNNFISDSSYPGTGYGISVANASTMITISKNRIENCRHCISGGTSDFEALNRAIIISENKLVGGTVADSNPIDTHQMTIDYTVTKNKIYMKKKPNDISGLEYYAFSDGSKTSIFSDNTIVGGGGVIRRGAIGNGSYEISGNTFKNTNGGAIYRYLGAAKNNTLKITNNIAESIDGTAISIDTELFKNLTIDGNIIDSVGVDAIHIKHSTSGVMSRIKIVNNILNNIKGNGIYVRRESPTDALELSISNNTITNVNTLAGTYNGIYIIDTQNADVINNIINGAYIGIRENTLLAESAANNNHIVQNNIHGCSYASILKIGANTQISNNPGYTTENTGTATITASQTSVTISHSLASTPTRIQLTPTTPTAGKQYYISEKAATTFTITIDSAAEADISFDWSAVV